MQAMQLIPPMTNVHSMNAFSLMPSQQPVMSQTTRPTVSPTIPIIDTKEDRMEALLQQMQDLHLNMIKSQDKLTMKNE